MREEHNCALDSRHPAGPCQCRGEILFRGKNLLTLGREPMRRIRGKEISMIFQEPMTSLNPVLTIGYQIAEVLMTHENMTKKDAMDKAVGLLRAVRIPSPELRIKEYPTRCQAA